MKENNCSEKARQFYFEALDLVRMGIFWETVINILTGGKLKGNTGIPKPEIITKITYEEVHGVPGIVRVAKVIGGSRS